MTDPITPLLAKAFPQGPKAGCLKSADAVVLGLHCLLVEDGFQAVDPRNTTTISGYTPPSNWNRVAEHEWIVTYTRKGATRRFRLHCSLQAATDRLFVHACEIKDNGEPAPENIQVMGLQLGNYVDAAHVQTDSWTGVVKNERTLAEMFSEFVRSPLWELAEKGVARNGTTNGVLSRGAAAGLWSATEPYIAKLKTAATDLQQSVPQFKTYLTKPSVAVPLAVGVTAITVGVVVWLKPKASALA